MFKIKESIRLKKESRDTVRLINKIEGLTPAGYCFMEYCQKVAEADKESSFDLIDAYEEYIQRLMKTFGNDRTTSAKTLWGILSTIYEGWGLA